MINSENILTIIPARGGSKGVLKKNIRELAGKPLIVYTIETALKSKYINKPIVSTDDEKIALIAQKFGADVPFIRPKKYSTDISKPIDVVKHALTEMEKKNKQIYPVVVYLEPPAPFKITQDIDTCIELFFKHDPGSVVSVTEANQYHPILMKKIENGYLKPLCIDYEEAGVPRQMYEPTAYMRNGAVYVIRRENIINNEFYGDPIIPYIMPEVRSLCIDSMLDWFAAESMSLSRSMEI